MNDMTEAVAAPQSISRAEHDAGMAAYREAGQRLAEKIGNRGPLRIAEHVRAVIDRVCEGKA